MNEVTERQDVNPIIAFKRNFTKLLDDGEFALPSNVKPEAFKNAAMVAVQDDPTILRADQPSLFKSLRRAAASGLVPDGREGALVKFRSYDKKTRQSTDVVQFMPMVFGLIKMVRRSGTVTDIRAHIVYQKEIDAGQFDYVVGDEEKLTHKPILFGDRGDPVACYAIAKLTDGTIVREFMSAMGIDTVRRAGASQKIYAKGEKPKVSDTPLGIWKDWWAEMWKKTVIRRLCKRLDMSADDVRRVMEDQEFDEMRDVTPKAGGFAAKAQAAREPAQETQEDHSPTEYAQIVPDEPQDDPAPADAPLDGEIVTTVMLDGLDLSEAFPGADEFTDGVKAFEAGMKVEMCPHMDDPQKATDWVGGFTQAQSAAGGESDG